MNPIVPMPMAAADDALPLLDENCEPILDHVVTEDDTPVDSIYTEKQQRLLTEALYSSWPGPGPGRSFLALANVGLFHTAGEPPWVPDFLLSLDVKAAADLHAKKNRSYFVWIFGKPPQVILEIVSDRRGGEEDEKLEAYARIGVLFYVIYDPEEVLDGGIVRAFVLQRGKYEPIDPKWLGEVGLGLTQWNGVYEGANETWLRWCDEQGRVIATGAERANEAQRQAEEAARQAEAAARQAEAAGQRAEEAQRHAEAAGRRAKETNEKLQRLEAQLRAHGIEPEG